MLMVSKDDFLYPLSTFRGDFTPEDFVFNANLQEFAMKIGYVVALQTNGKITSEQAYQDIKKLVKELKISRKELGIKEQDN